MNSAKTYQLKRKFGKEGLLNFSERQIFVLLLSFITTQKKAIKITDDLFEYFDNSLVSILNASEERLMKITGISKNSVKYLHLISEFYHSYESMKDNNMAYIDNMAKIRTHLVHYYRNFIVETVVLLCIDSSLKIISSHVIHVGCVNSASVNSRKIVEITLSENASGVVIAHNHPSGVPVPSPEDIVTTRRLHQLLNQVEINFLEHYLVTDNDIKGLKWMCI